MNKKLSELRHSVNQEALNYPQSNILTTQRNYLQPITDLMIKSRQKFTQRQHLFSRTRKMDENYNIKPKILSMNQHYSQKAYSHHPMPAPPDNNETSFLKGEINEFQQLEQSRGQGSRIDHHSYVQKCRIATHNYDILKNQIVCKKKFKKQCKNLHNSKTDLKPNDNLSTAAKMLTHIESSKENRELMRRFSNHHNTRRFWSEDHCERKWDRYANISIAEFMEEKEENISARMRQKFEKYRKQKKKLPNPEIQHSKPPHPLRTLYPLVTCRLQQPEQICITNM